MEGQVAIVTGGATGIGREYVKVLLSRNVKVCIADIDSSTGQQAVESLEKAYSGCAVVFEKCDVTDKKLLDDVFTKTHKTFGRLDIVINNAGILNEGQLEATIAINLYGVIWGTQKALELMRTDKGGKGGLIINIGSIVGLMPSPASPIYSTTKHAVVGYTRSMGATSLPFYGVRMNCICPSYADTSLLHLEDKSKLSGPSVLLEAALAKLKETKLLAPDTVAQCLVPFLDDVTLSGAAILCTSEHPRAMLKLPGTIEDLHQMYLP